MIEQAATDNARGRAGTSHRETGRWRLRGPTSEVFWGVGKQKSFLVVYARGSLAGSLHATRVVWRSFFAEELSDPQPVYVCVLHFTAVL